MRAIEESYLSMTDGDREGMERAVPKRMLSLQSLCDICETDPEEVLLTLREVARLHDGQALAWLAFQSIVELREEGFAIEVEDDPEDEV